MTQVCLKCDYEAPDKVLVNGQRIVGYCPNDGSVLVPSVDENQPELPAMPEPAIPVAAPTGETQDPPLTPQQKIADQVFELLDARFPGAVVSAMLMLNISDTDGNTGSAHFVGDPFVTLQGLEHAARSVKGQCLKVEYEKLTGQSIDG